ncbi:MAG: type II 3-dehydroquinate dehydratase [Calditerrivibrio sp.]|nr:type II 3-dehydroquinate dehydratase [Calditerrivibrio sp.]MCA1932001.1 type II 3-dehydroquinate dehydratase [Calditerrivibrio sp.]MCA1981131.1 type II 3-dehydroquinate dehydratase [Calditerrivibrio sp.]
MKRILVLNGPNLNMLGKREPDVYGRETYEEIMTELSSYIDAKGFKADFYQSNIEGELINRIHSAIGFYDYIIINPGAFTHTSVALRDALLSVSIPFIEVHLSNIFSREPFRHHSYLSDVAKGVITGFGKYSYFMAVDFLFRIM